MNRDLIRGVRAARYFAERLKDDPVFQFQPLSWQQRFVESQARECWAMCSNRAGKSDAVAWIAACYLRFGDPDPKGAYSSDGRIVVYDRAVSAVVDSPTLDLSRAVMQPKMFNNGFVPANQAHPPFIPDAEILKPYGWSEKKRALRLKNGSMCRYMAYEQGREAHQGLGAQIIILDEAPPRYIYNELAIRVEAGTRLIVRGALTLLGDDSRFATAGHWLYAEKISPWQRKEHDPKELEIINASIYENTHLCAHIHGPGEPHVGCEIARLESIYPPGSMDRRIRMNGELLPGMLGAVAYAAFDRQIHVNPALDVERHRDWRTPLIFCYDSNISPAGALICQEFRGGFVRVIDEIFLEQGSPYDVAEEFARRFPSHGAELQIYGDATAQRQNAHTAKSDYDLLTERFKSLPYPHRFYLPRVNPPVRDRINAVNFALIGPQQRVNLEIAPHCTELIEDLETVQRDRYGGIKKAHDKRDPYYRRTHLSDALGYFLVYRHPVSAVIDPAAGEASYRVPMPGYIRRR